MTENSAHPDWLLKLGVFDLETTGVDVLHDRVVTANVGVIDKHGQVISSRSWLVDPGIPIPAQASAVHGITTERARAEGQHAAEAVRDIRDALAELLAADIPVVAYNASFDFSLIAAECKRYAVDALHARPIIDPLVIDKQVDRYRRGKRTLNLVAEHYGVHLDGAHEAAADAQAAGRVALALISQHREQLPDSAAALHDAQVEWAKQQAASLTEYLIRVGRLQPGEAVESEWPVRTA
jgi:DNA polymerase-3 subunit epsilon